MIKQLQRRLKAWDRMQTYKNHVGVGARTFHARALGDLCKHDAPAVFDSLERDGVTYTNIPLKLREDFDLDSLPASVVFAVGWVSGFHTAARGAVETVEGELWGDAWDFRVSAADYGFGEMLARLFNWDPGQHYSANLDSK